MRQLNKMSQRGAVDFFVILLIVIIVGLIGFIAWQFVSNDSDPEAEQASVTNQPTGQETTDGPAAESATIEIAELGIAIEDPEARGIMYQRVEIENPVGAPGDVEVFHMIEDESNIWKDDCGYPVFVNPVENFDGNGNERPYKTINGTVYMVGSGSNFQSRCTVNSKIVEEHSEYSDDLNQYVYDNLIGL